MRTRNEEILKKRLKELGFADKANFREAVLPVILTNEIALSGTAALARAYTRELTRRLHPDFVRQAAGLMEATYEDAVPEAAAYVSCACWPLGEGGILAGLWTLAGELSCSLEVDMRSIPIRQETVEICEYFEIDPYTLSSSGACLIVTKEERKLLSALRSAGTGAQVIGTVTAGNDCILLNAGRIRYLNRPEKDPLERLMKQPKAIVAGQDLSGNRQGDLPCL